MMKMIITLIGSSVFGAIISYLFTWFTNKKNNSLSYITDERRKWREKIREIVNGIEKSEFQGVGNKNVNQYLIQLQVSINPYGRKSKIDYARDGHIWDIIDKIRNSKTEIEFEKRKNILIQYLSLMLKRDWERSKTEIQGYSKILVYIAVILFNSLLYGAYYFSILKLESIPVFMITLIINTTPIFVVKFFWVDEFDAIVNDRKKIPIKLVKKKERKIKKITVYGTIYILLILICNMFLGMFYYPKVMSEEMSYCKENNTIYLYTDLDFNLVGNLEESLQHNVEDKVTIVRDKSELPVDQEREDDVILEKAIRDCIFFWTELITLLALFISVLALIFVSQSGMETRKYSDEIERIDYFFNYRYRVSYEQILLLIERINLEPACDMKQNSFYFGLIYSLLSDIGKYLNIVVLEDEKFIESVEEYDILVLKKEKLEQVRNGMKQIKVIDKKVSLKGKQKLFPSLKECITKIDLENINLEY